MIAVSTELNEFRLNAVLAFLSVGTANARAEIYDGVRPALGGSPTGKGDKKASVQGDTFGSPDGLKFASNGLLWVQTDVSTSTLNEKDYAGMGNNQMLAVIPELLQRTEGYGYGYGSRSAGKEGQPQ